MTVHIATPPGLVWDLVSDVTRVGEFSLNNTNAASTLPHPQTNAMKPGFQRVLAP